MLSKYHYQFSDFEANITKLFRDADIWNMANSVYDYANAQI